MSITMKLITPGGPLLTVAEAAAIMRVSQRTIRAMIADGRLRAIRPRGLDVVRIPQWALVALLGREVLGDADPEDAAFPVAATNPRQSESKG
jgi:excisionase family DNA binding protein